MQNQISSSLYADIPCVLFALYAIAKAIITNIEMNLQDVCALFELGFLANNKRNHQEKAKPSYK